jgi:hypothetical protein
MTTGSRGERPINDCFVKKMGNPFLSCSKVPIIATTEFITRSIAMDEMCSAKTGDETLW